MGLLFIILRQYLGLKPHLYDHETDKLNFQASSLSATQQTIFDNRASWYSAPLHRETRKNPNSLRDPLCVPAYGRQGIASLSLPKKDSS